MNTNKLNLTTEEFNSLIELGWIYDSINNDLCYLDNHIIVILKQLKDKIVMISKINYFYSNRQYPNSDIRIDLELNQGIQYYHDIAMGLIIASKLK